MATQIQVRYIWAFGWSLVIVSVLSSLLVIFKETNVAIKALMQTATGHHWVTHSIIVLMLFIVLGWLLSKAGATSAGNGGLNALAVIIMVATIISGLMLAGFFLLH
ncbi:MAG: hypothetical protein HY308_11525 [Gammaproteobacteria bacterium]|nr:hypothetical protein [Gammaproteobacteria bacterium]